MRLTKRTSALAVALAAGLLASGAGLTEAPVEPVPARPQEFAGRYALGPGWMPPAGVMALWEGPRGLPQAATGGAVPLLPQALFGVILCPVNLAGLAQTPGPSAGGACGPVAAHPDDIVAVRALDDSGRAVPFAVCVDKNWDGICRPDGFPEGSEDFVHFHEVGQAGLGAEAASWAVFSYKGPTAPTSVFMMSQTDTAAVATPSTGRLEGFTVPRYDAKLREFRTAECSDGKDNDGDGLFDYPLDKDCDAPGDDLERTPQCMDGKDNDGNLRRDYPDDPGCRSKEQLVETNPYPH